MSREPRLAIPRAQPRGPSQVNTGSKFSRDLAVVYLPGFNLYKALTGQRISITNESNLELRVDRDGRGVGLINTAGSQVSFDGFGVDQVEVTTFVLWKNQAAHTNGNVTINAFRFRGTTATADHAVLNQSKNANTRFSVGGVFNTETDYLDYVCCISDVGTSSAYRHRGYVGNKNIMRGPYQTNNFNNSFGLSRIAPSLAQNIYAVFSWRRVLTLEEVKEFARDPYQVLTPARA